MKTELKDGEYEYILYLNTVLTNIYSPVAFH